MTLHEVEIAGTFAWHPQRLVYVPGQGVLVLWVNEEDRNRLCAVVQPTRDHLPAWAQEGWEHLGACHCGWCTGDWT